MKRIIVIISVLALLAAACGAGDVGSGGSVTLPPSDGDTTTSTPTTTVPGGDTTQPTQPDDGGSETADQIFVELFFVKEGISAKSVIRAVDTPDVAANAIRALIEGPTPAEQDTELSTAVPADTLLLGLTIRDGLATIDLSREFEAGGGSANILSRLAQVVYTLTQFPTVDRVVFHLDGEPVGVFSGEGVVLDGPVSRSDYAGILPIEPGPDTSAAEPWGQADLPDVTGVDPAGLGRVALVAADDVLNVRRDPTAGAPVVGMLLPGVVVKRTGPEQVSGSSVWAEIETPTGGFWVNSWYLAAVVTGEDFAGDAGVPDLLDEFAGVVAAGGDLRAVTSRRGLYVSHHADPVRFSPDQLATILTSATTYRWPLAAIGDDDSVEIPPRTFTAAVADGFLSAYDDPDRATTVNQAIAGGNGRPPEMAIPDELRSFNYIGVHDPGDDPQYGGLDWVTWYVSIDYEDGAPVIVGLTVDAWSP
jgi:hypothetical protein